MIISSDLINISSKLFTKRQIFRHIQIESICRQQNRYDTKTEICFETERRKHCGEKEKMLVTSIFSFSHNVFKRLHSEGVKSWEYVVKG